MQQKGVQAADYFDNESVIAGEVEGPAEFSGGIKLGEHVFGGEGEKVVVGWM
jgi:hypothetical protein